MRHIGVILHCANLVIQLTNAVSMIFVASALSMAPCSLVCDVKPHNNSMHTCKHAAISYKDMYEH